MDAHHDIVRKAREQAGDGTLQYFAYSTILDAEAFQTWRAQHGYDDFSLPTGRLAEALDVALVYDFPSRWWGGRVAGLADAPGQVVYGVLFEIAAKDWAVVQHKEGAVTGMSIERTLKVKAGGAIVEAVAFVTAPARQSSDGPVSPGFVEALVRGAKSAGLPQTWIESLAASAR